MQAVAKLEKGAAEMKFLTKSFRRRFGAADAHVQLSLPIAGVLRDVRSAFFGFCINIGKAALAAMMKAGRTALCSPKVVPDPQRTAYRGRHTRTPVILGGRRIAILRPRAHCPASSRTSASDFPVGHAVRSAECGDAFSRCCPLSGPGDKYSIRTNQEFVKERVIEV
jgi:hypothetical protein